MTREEAIQWLKAMKSAYALPIETYEAIDMAIEALSADAVEVVRCKDCRKGKTTDEDELVFCQVFQKWFAETFFCADGERSEE